jgi:flagellar biosynthetic protein FliR
VIEQLFSISPEWSANFLLVLARISAAVIAMPLFGARGVPSQTKIGLALLLALIVVPLQGPHLRPIPTNLIVFSSLIGSEVLIGIALGVAVSLIFHAMQMGASLVGVQMGFGIGAVIDPMTGGQVGTLDQFYQLLVTLVFFAVNGHLIVIQGLLHSFQVVPPGAADISLIAGDKVTPFFASLFVVAIRISLPVVGALLLTDIAMALVGRTVPQMNVLIVGFPVKIAVGLLVLAAAMPLLTGFMAATFGRALLDVNGFLVP